MHIVFVGAGRLGNALAKMIKTSGAQIDMWDVVPGVVKNQKPLNDIVPKADVLFLCVNSWQVRDAAKLLKPHLHKKTIIVSPSKGMEQKTGLTVDVLLADAFGKTQPIALLSGPMLAHELAGKNAFGAAVVATSKEATFAKIAPLFQKAPLHLTHSTDLRGVALAGVLKNAYALLLGIAESLHLGQNAKGHLTMRAVHEMIDIIHTLSPKSSLRGVVLGPAALGDLVATAHSPKSTNVTMGRELVAGRKPTRMSEGLASLPPLLKRLGKQKEKYPLLSATAAIALQKKDAKKALKLLLLTKQYSLK